MAVTNRGDRPIQVGSHYHFVETNRALAFDRGAGLRHASRHSRRHGGAIRAGRDEDRSPRRDRRAPRDRRWQYLRASGPVTGGRTGACRGRLRPTPIAMAQESGHEPPDRSTALRRHLRSDRRAIASDSATPASSPKSSRTRRSTATSASSAAARCCATGWDRRPASPTTARSIASSPTRSSSTGPAFARPTSASSTAASRASARPATRT